MRDFHYIEHHRKVTRPGKKSGIAARGSAVASYPDILDQLRDLIPDAVIFTGFRKYATLDEETDSAEECGDAAALPRAIYAMKGMQLSQQEIAHISETFYRSSGEQAAVEAATREQRECLSWYQQRYGRITASNFGSIIKRKSAVSLLRKARDITEPPLVSFERIHRLPKPIRYGIEKDHVARNEYVAMMESSHDGFTCVKSGLQVHKDIGYIGASPDGITHCLCCGRGILEIKCPYRYRGTNLLHVEDRTFYLDANQSPKENHDYAYRDQVAIECVRVDFCDFVCWTGKSEDN